jgi:hypothetical protein
LGIGSGGVGLGTEGSASNRLDGSKSEKHGVVFEKVFVEVCGVPLELTFLRNAEEHGLVPKGHGRQRQAERRLGPGTGIDPSPDSMAPRNAGGVAGNAIAVSTLLPFAAGLRRPRHNSAGDIGSFAWGATPP